MTKERVSVNYDLYQEYNGFDDLKQAVEKLTSSSQDQFESIKKEKWFNRLWDFITFSQKKNKRIAAQISTLAQAQEILMEILVRLSAEDARVADLVKICMTDIRHLSENDIHLSTKIQYLENVCILGIKKSDDIANLSRQNKEILSGCLYLLSERYETLSAQQQQYANNVLKYIGVDAEISDLSQALSNMDVQSKRAILTCVIEFIYLYELDYSIPSELTDFVEEFDFGSKTINDITSKLQKYVGLRGAYGIVSKYSNDSFVDIDDEFYIDIDDDFANNETSDPTDDTIIREEITISNTTHIAEGEDRVYRDKILHIKANMICEGNLSFENCIIHYGETALPYTIEFKSEGIFTVNHCTFENHSTCDKVFIDAPYHSENKIIFANCKFINCSNLINSSRIGIVFDSCEFCNPGNNLINLSGWLNDSICEITRCRFFFESAPDFVKQDSTIINVNILLFNECSVRGKPPQQKKQFFLHDHFSFITANDCNITNSTIMSTRSFARLDSGKISRCEFIGSEHIIESYYSSSDKKITIEDCRFDKCTRILTALYSSKSCIQYCQFNDCYNMLVDVSGTNISYCDFNNWIGDMDRKSEPSSVGFEIQAMLEFSKSTDKCSSRIEKCTFNAAVAMYDYIILGKTTEYIAGTIVSVSDCIFSNCQSKRKSHKLIREEDQYKSMFGTPKWIKTVSIYNCHGWDQATNFPITTANVDIKKATSSGESIGCTALTIVD